MMVAIEGRERDRGLAREGACEGSLIELTAGSSSSMHIGFG